MNVARDEHTSTVLIVTNDVTVADASLQLAASARPKTCFRNLFQRQIAKHEGPYICTQSSWLLSSSKVSSPRELGPSAHIVPVCLYPALHLSRERLFFKNRDTTRHWHWLEKRTTNCFARCQRPKGFIVEPSRRSYTTAKQAAKIMIVQTCIGVSTLLYNRARRCIPDELCVLAMLAKVRLKLT